MRSAGIVASGVASQVCVALPAGDDGLRQLCEDFRVELVDGGPLLTTVDGGATRADSVRSALAALEDGTEAVLVHDAARALTPESVFHRVAACAGRRGTGRHPGHSRGGHGQDGRRHRRAATRTSPLNSSPERHPGRSCGQSRLRRASSFETLRQAHQAALGFDERQAAAVTDDAMLVELLGVPVHAVRGASQSLKITTPLDLIIAEGLLEGPLGVRWVEG